MSWGRTVNTSVFITCPSVRKLERHASEPSSGSSTAGQVCTGRPASWFSCMAPVMRRNRWSGVPLSPSACRLRITQRAPVCPVSTRWRMIPR